MTRITRNMFALTVLALGLFAVPADAQPCRPFHGSFATTFTQTPTANPGVFTLQFNVVGHASHLGLTTGSATHTLDFTGPAPVQTGPTTYIAANGDQLWATYSGTSTAPVNGVLQFSGTQTITGGTGRFSTATGTSLVQGSANVVTNVGQFTFSGTLCK